MDTFTIFEQIDEREFTDVPAEVWDEFFAEGEDPEH